MVDAFGMFGFANWVISESSRTLLGYQAVMGGTALLLAVGFWTEPIVLRSVLVAAMLMCCAVSAWRAHRQAVADRLRKAGGAS